MSGIEKAGAQERLVLRRLHNQDVYGNQDQVQYNQQILDLRDSFGPGFRDPSIEGELLEAAGWLNTQCVGILDPQVKLDQLHRWQTSPISDWREKIRDLHEETRQGIVQLIGSADRSKLFQDLGDARVKAPLLRTRIPGLTPARADILVALIQKSKPPVPAL